MNTAVSALILAGSRPGAPDPVAVAERVSHKALVTVGGRLMLERVIAAVRDSGIERIVVAADHPEVIALAQSCGAEVMAPEAGPSASVAAGFALLGAPMLVTTADHALLKGEWIRNFVAAMPLDADVAVLMARRDTVLRAIPTTRRTWLRFADGRWSGCNLFLLAGPNAARALDAWKTIESHRKRPWRLVASLGLGTLFNYARGKLTVSEAMLRLGLRFGLVARMIAANDGLAAIDVDKPEDLADVRRAVRRL